MAARITTSTDSAGMFVRTLTAEIVALHLLKDEIAEHPEVADIVVAELRAAIDDVTAQLRRLGKPESAPLLAALPVKLDEMVRQIEAMKPKEGKSS